MLCMVGLAFLFVGALLGPNLFGHGSMAGIVCEQFMAAKFKCIFIIMVLAW